MRDEGLVLRTRDLGEADRIVTLLTRDRGRVRAVAKGVRRTSSRFGARLEPFAHVDVLIHSGRTLDIVTQVETLDSYGRELVGDYPSWTAGQAMLEAAERLTPIEEEQATQQYLLLVGGLRAMSRREHAPTLVLDAFLLRSLAISGWAPSFGECARCGEPGPHRAFHPASGGAQCESCHPPGAATPSEATMALLGALLSGNWEHADASGGSERRQASGLVAAMLNWHLERGLKSLRLVDRSTSQAPQPRTQ